MKKQNFTRQTAYVVAPNDVGSFTPTSGYNSEVSVAFNSKDVSIYGYDGASWTLIYSWNGLDPQYTFNGGYVKYYLLSNTGQQETMGVSFFSVDEYVNSNPTGPTSKFHDIEEVPVYTPSDSSKMLTVMSDGSLRWLLSTESYTVSGGESSTPVSYTFPESSPTWISSDSFFKPYGDLTGLITTKGATYRLIWRSAYFNNYINVDDLAVGASAGWECNLPVNATTGEISNIQERLRAFVSDGVDPAADSASYEIIAEKALTLDHFIIYDDQASLLLDDNFATNKANYTEGVRLMVLNNGGGSYTFSFENNVGGTWTTMASNTTTVASGMRIYYGHSSKTKNDKNRITVDSTLSI